MREIQLPELDEVTTIYHLNTISQINHIVVFAECKMWFYDIGSENRDTAAGWLHVPSVENVQDTYPSLKNVEKKYLKDACRDYYNRGSPEKPHMSWIPGIKDKAGVKVVYGGYPGLIVSRLVDPKDLWTATDNGNSGYLYVKSTEPREIQVFMSYDVEQFQFIEVIDLNEHDQQGDIRDMLTLGDGRVAIATEHSIGVYHPYRTQWVLSMPVVQCNYETTCGIKLYIFDNDWLICVLDSDNDHANIQMICTEPQHKELLKLDKLRRTELHIEHHHDQMCYALYDPQSYHVRCTVSYTGEICYLGDDEGAARMKPRWKKAIEGYLYLYQYQYCFKLILFQPLSQSQPQSQTASSEKEDDAELSYLFLVDWVHGLKCHLLQMAVT